MGSLTAFYEIGTMGQHSQMCRKQFRKLLYVISYTTRARNCCISRKKNKAMFAIVWKTIRKNKNIHMKKGIKTKFHKNISVIINIVIFENKANLCCSHWARTGLFGIQG